MSSEIIYFTQPAPFWDWRVATDLFLGGAGVGALLFGVLLDEWFKGKYHRICVTAAWLSPVLVTAGLMFLMMKMGRPLHLFFTYTNFNPHSPLWWGGVFQPLFLIAAIAYAFMWRHDTPNYLPRRWLGRAITPLAFIVGTYHGLLLAHNVSRPLWNTGPTVVAAILGFVTTGIAAVMLVHLIRAKWAGRLANQDLVTNFLNDMNIVRNMLTVALIFQLATFYLWWLSLKYGSLSDQQALAAANESYGPMFWYLGIGVGLIIPIALGVLALIRGEAMHRRFQTTMIAVTSALILFGGFFFRLALVLGGQVELPINPFS